MYLMILYRNWFIGVCSNDNENTIKAFKKEISHVRLHNLPFIDREIVKIIKDMRYLTLQCQVWHKHAQTVVFTSQNVG